MLKTVSTYINVIGSLVYKGTWNAATNSPFLQSSVGDKGDYYVVSQAGSTNLNGITDWKVNDIAVFNGAVWEKIDNTDAVLSVNGQTGAVVLTASDVGATPNTTYVLASGLLSGGGQLNANVTVSLTSVPVANVPGAVPNTVNVLAGGLLSGGGALTGNVTISLTSVPAANVSGLGTMATQNANNVTITGGNINSVAHSGGTFANANITSVAATFPNSYLSNSTATLGNATITLGSTTNSVGNLTLANANITSVAATFPNSYLANSTATLGNATITLGSTTTSVGNLTLTNVTVSSGSVTANISSSTVNFTGTTSANATFATSSLPLVPEGYITVQIGGINKKIPYYGV